MSTAFLLWLVLSSLFLAFFSSRLRDHWYYADVALPPLAYFTAQGLLAACRLLSRPDAAAYFVLRAARPVRAARARDYAAVRRAAHGALRPLVLALDIALVPRWTVPANLQLLALVLAGSVLLWLMSPRASLVVASFAFCAVARGALPRATGDALASLTERAGTETDVARYRAQVLKPLREAVNRYSTRANLVVTNRRDPTTLHEAHAQGLRVLARGT